MITKNAWEELLWKMKCAKEHPYAWQDWEINDMYLNLIILIVGSPLVILLDIVLAPFEIGLYFFNKYMRGDFK